MSFCADLFERVCVLALRCVLVRVCARVCAGVRACASAAAEHTNQQEALIDLCSMFSHNLRGRDWARAEVKKGEQICQSLFAMLVWNESTLCYLKHTQIRDVSSCQVKEKKNQLLARVLFSLPHSTCFSPLLNWYSCFWRDKGGLPLDLNIEELRIDIVKPYLHVYQSHSKRLLLTKLIRWN